MSVPLYLLCVAAPSLFGWAVFGLASLFKDLGFDPDDNPAFFISFFLLIATCLGVGAGIKADGLVYVGYAAGILACHVLPICTVVLMRGLDLEEKAKYFLKQAYWRVHDKIAGWYTAWNSRDSRVLAQADKLLKQLCDSTPEPYWDDVRELLGRVASDTIPSLLKRRRELRAYNARIAKIAKSRSLRADDQTAAAKARRDIWAKIERVEEEITECLGFLTGFEISVLRERFADETVGSSALLDTIRERVEKVAKTQRETAIEAEREVALLVPSTAE